jgi:hypothetical protein
MFQGRGSDVPQVASGQGFSFFASSTWMFRRAFMEDFQIRAACPRFLFRVRRCFPILLGGVKQEWVVEYNTETKRSYHVQGPDGKRMMQPAGTGGRKLPDGRHVHGSRAERWEPEYEEFPSHEFQSQGPFLVQGDDGAVWDLGSRGNALPILREEVTHFAMLWPNEKIELHRWFDGDRKLTDEKLIRRVDRYYVHQIQSFDPGVTEAEIAASGLPDPCVENLIYNLQNYKKKP